MLFRVDTEGKAAEAVPTGSDNAWITWLQHTKAQARFALPDEEDFPEQMAVKSHRGWTTLAVVSEADLSSALELIHRRLDHVEREGALPVIASG